MKRFLLCLVLGVVAGVVLAGVEPPKPKPGTTTTVAPPIDSPIQASKPPTDPCADKKGEEALECNCKLPPSTDKGQCDNLCSNKTLASLPGSDLVCCANSADYKKDNPLQCTCLDPSLSKNCSEKCEHPAPKDESVCCAVLPYSTTPLCACKTHKTDPICTAKRKASSFPAGTFFGGVLLGIILCFGMILIYNVWLKRRLNNPGLRAY